MNITDLVAQLKQPIPYQWRVQSRNKDKTKAFCSAYIDARQVMDTLDKHCRNGWQSDFKDINGFIFAGIGITKDDGSVVWRWDCGARVENDLVIKHFTHILMKVMIWKMTILKDYK